MGKGERTEGIRKREDMGENEMHLVTEMKTKQLIESRSISSEKEEEKERERERQGESFRARGHSKCNSNFL